MFFSTLSFAALLSLASAAPQNVRATLPPFFLLAGDSTTCSGKGWGDGFINKTILSPAKGINYGHSGATIPSFRSGGDWANVLASVKKYKSDYEVLVTIQFGHNDQKIAADEAAYSSNLKQLVTDVTGAGGTPIVVTPLTRRSFSNGKVVQSLSNETAKALAVASSTGSRVIDLNKASTNYVNAIGEAAAQTYDLDGTDTTHLNLWGSVVFGRLVSDLLVAKYADVAAYTVKNATLTGLLNAGKVA